MYIVETPKWKPLHERIMDETYFGHAQNLPNPVEVAPRNEKKKIN